jgi:succinate dehydrogenase / fumarate reductase cytochrome b subunit
MSLVTGFYRSSLGKKAVMAVTGLILFGFVLGHMAGNLKLYQGEAAYDAYAEHLRELGAPIFAHGQLLWVFRLGLLAAVGLHLHAATVLTLQNRRARPAAYELRETLQATYAARTMRWGGVIVLLFVLYHLAHLTFGWAHPDFEPGKVFQNVIVGFSIPWVAVFYVVANFALGLHLYHGVWSLFQSLGWNHPKLNPWRRRLAAFFAAAVTLGNVSFPLAVLTGVVR